MTSYAPKYLKLGRYLELLVLVVLALARELALGRHEAAEEEVVVNQAIDKVQVLCRDLWPRHARAHLIKIFKIVFRTL